MDASKLGSRVLQVTTRKLDSNAIAVTFEDTGPGIAPEKLKGIFDAFVTTKPKGMGLGLAICRMIVERHGGELSAWSKQKETGAMFQVTLPAEPHPPD